MRVHHSKDEMIVAARAVVAEEGLANLTYRKVAARLGIADRTVVYYFENKDKLVGEIVGTARIEFQHLLNGVMGRELVDAARIPELVWPALATPEADATFKVFFEVLGLSAAGVQPYAQLSEPLVEAWVDWVAERVKGRSSSERRRSALGVIAKLDGLLLMRQTLGSDAASCAAIELGLDVQATSLTS